jgi:O-antigen ligase
VRKTARCLLWLFVFSLPWEAVVSFAWIGTISRLLGVAAAGAGVLTVVMEGRFRRPGAIFWLASAFVLSNVLSLFWTISVDASIGRIATYAQLLGLVWLVWEFAREREEQERLMVAYCLGAFVTMTEMLANFNAGIAYEELRYAASGFDPNDCGLTLALGLPMAWHLFLNHRGTVRFVAIGYLPIAAVSILLTGSRGAFSAAIVALSIIPLAMPRKSLRSFVLTAAVLLVAGIAAAAIVPQTSWERIVSTTDEVQSGTLNGRTEIWRVAVRVFEERPVLGVGAGAFRSAVEPFMVRSLKGHHRSAHNVMLAVLVEQGLVGFFVFLTLLGTCAWCVGRMRPSERKLWAVLTLTWLVGSMSLGWQYRKPTWLLIGLLAAQAAVTSRRARAIVAPVDAARWPGMLPDRRGPADHFEMVQ